MADPSVPRAFPAGSRVKEAQPEIESGSRANLMRTSAGEVDNVVVQQAVFVVMQDDPYGNGGPVFWQVSVWRFTVVARTAPHVISGTSSKSI
jgi:hypothetical protein